MKKTLLIFMVMLFSTYAYALKSTPNTDKTLDKSCTKCHIMYHAEFLPSSSWNILFSDKSLGNHFGEKVALEHGVKKRFLAYYLQYASDVSKKKLAKKINRSIPNPEKSNIIKITKVPFIEGKHEDLTDEMVLKNPKVKLYSNCKACHGDNAIKGLFDEDKVKVPGWNKGFFGWSKK